MGNSQVHMLNPPHNHYEKNCPGNGFSPVMVIVQQNFLAFSRPRTINHTIDDVRRIAKIADVLQFLTPPQQSRVLYESSVQKSFSDYVNRQSSHEWNLDIASNIANQFKI
jgi:ketol-acid reductoisomerase